MRRFAAGVVAIVLIAGGLAGALSYAHGMRPRHRGTALVRPASTRTRSAHAAGPSSPRRAPQPPLATVLDRALRESAKRIHAPAATAALVRCGRVVWSGATGVLSLATRQAATGSSLFVLNSAAKTVVATMVLQEVQAGRLSLDTRISRFLPGLPNARRITVRMLLNMTSGLPDYLYTPRISWMIANRPRHRWTFEQLLTGLGGGLGRPRFAPGHGYQYSDTNYIALGAILVDVTHSSIEQDFQRLIAAPLGLTAATWVPTPAALAQVAHPYVLYRDGTLHSRWIPGYGISSAVWGQVFTDGGLASSSLDLAEFANALIGGRLVRPALVREMIHIGTGDYGFGIRRRSFGGRPWLGHAGYFGGFSAQDWTDRSRQLSFAGAANVEKSGSPSLDPVRTAIMRAYDRRFPHLTGCPAPAASQTGTTTAPSAGTTTT